MVENNLTANSNIDIIHGVRIADPYRWLEDRTFPETQKWIAEQRDIYDRYFSRLPRFEYLRSRVKHYLDVETTDQPSAVGNLCFFRRRNRGQEQASIYVRDEPSGHERILVDPSAKGPFTAVSLHRISEDGRLLAYSLKQGGERQVAIGFIDVETGEFLSDELPRGLARGLVFKHSLTGFYYCHETNSALKTHQILYHQLGTPLEQDQVLFEAARTSRSRLILTSDNVRLGALVSNGTGREITISFYVAEFKTPESWNAVFLNRPAPYGAFLWNGEICVQKFLASKKSCIVALNTDGAEDRIIVPPLSKAICGLRLTQSRIYVSHSERAGVEIQCWNKNGDFLGLLPKHAEGTLSLLPAYTTASDVLFFRQESFAQSPTILRYLPDQNAYIPWHTQHKAPIEPKIRRVSYRSKDDTKIPMWLVSLHGTECSEKRPVILTGYGAAGISMTPRFSVLVTIMLEMGAIFALPNIRGGSEVGITWHESARGRNHQISFDDFIAAAEWLCENKITEPRQLGIFGGSFSGLLVGVAMTQRPDLFRAVLCIAPLLDMLRYEKFGDAFKWKAEFGTVDDPDEFHALLAYSPYHHVEERQNYPATLFIAGDKDGQCDPAHVRKMAAHMQQHFSQTNPVLVDYNMEGGHSAVQPLSVRIEALTRRIAFLCHELGISLPEEAPK